MYYWVLLLLALLSIAFIQIRKSRLNNKANNLLMERDDLSKIYFFFNEGEISSNQFSILSVGGEKPTIAEDVNGTFVLVKSGEIPITISYQYLGLKSIRKRNEKNYEFTSTEIFPIEKNRIYKLVINPETEKPALQLIL